jgi:hypothetical protein
VKEAIFTYEAEEFIELLNILYMEPTQETTSNIQNNAPLKETEEPEPELREGTKTVFNLTEGV